MCAASEILYWFLYIRTPPQFVELLGDKHFEFPLAVITVALWPHDSMFLEPECYAEL